MPFIHHFDQEIEMHSRQRKDPWPLLLLILLLMPLQYLKANDSDSLKAVLFYPVFCEQCQAVIDDFLLPLTANQGQRLVLFPIDITEPPGDEIFKQVLPRLGPLPDVWDKPTIVTGQMILHGEAEITERLPLLLKGELTPALSNWPDLSGLAALMRGEVSDDATVANRDADPLANMLAWSLLVGMLVSLLFAAPRLIRKGSALSDMQALRSWSLPIFALTGLGIGIYLSYETLTNSQIMCGPIGDCMSVQTSPYAKLFTIPMSMWGVVFYLGILLLWLSQRFVPGVWGRRAMLGLTIFSVFGVIFSVYLTSLELFVIHAVCLWCLSSAVLATLIMLTVILKTTGEEVCSTVTSVPRH